MIFFLYVTTSDGFDEKPGPVWKYAAESASIQPGAAAAVQLDDRWWAICNDRGTFYACDNLCPHAGGPLGRGDVHDGCVVCPVHGWPWDLRTGLSAPGMPWMRLRRYRCEVRAGKVYVDLSAPIPPAHSS